MQLNGLKEVLYTDCFESVLACVASHLNRHYEWMYLNEWRFRFELPPPGTMNRLGNAFILHRDKVGPLAKFHGIRYYQNSCEDISKLQDIFKDESAKELPVAVRVDTYHCAWDKSFGKYHNTNHIFLLNGRDEKTGAFICSDPFYHEWDRLISMETFKMMYAGQCGMFKVTEDISSGVDGVKIFQEMLHSLFKEQTFDAIRKLGEETETADFMLETDNGKAAWFAPVYRSMIDIANSRSRLLPFITFIIEQYGCQRFRPIFPLLEEISEEWRQVRDLVLKLLMTEQGILKNRIASKIINLAKSEENAAETLLNI